VGRLAQMLVGAPMVPEDGIGAPAASPDAEPLRRQNSSVANRTRVQENQRILAAQLLQEMLPVLGCVVILIPGLLLVAMLIASMAIYVLGWMVMSNFSSKACDEPLKWWLFAMLLIPILQCQLNSQQQPDQRLKRLQALFMPVAILAGVYMVTQSKTCHETNPELFQYAKMYLTYQAVVLMVMFFMHFFLHWGFMTLIFWMHRHGMLDSGPGPNSAARSGLIADIETVSYSPELFADEDKGESGEQEPPECSICQEEFEEGEELKKTPCGHYFHEPCLGQWLENYARSCPLCRTNVEEAMDEPHEPEQSA